MFDDLLVIDHGCPSREPSSAAYGSRRLVLARAALTFQGAFSDAYNLAVSSTAGIELSQEMSSLDFANLEKKAWDSKWEGRRFTKLWEQRENLELLRYKLRHNTQTIKRLGKTPKGIEHDYLGYEGGFDSPKDKMKQLAERVHVQEQDDLGEWISLDETAEYINQVVVRTTESYLQTVSARESQASNFQALRYAVVSSG